MIKDLRHAFTLLLPGPGVMPVAGASWLARVEPACGNAVAATRRLIGEFDPHREVGLRTALGAVTIFFGPHVADRLVGATPADPGLFAATVALLVAMAVAAAPGRLAARPASTPCWRSNRNNHHVDSECRD